jgi:membrane protease YdiL (CAAX protease family)
MAFFVFHFVWRTHTWRALAAVRLRPLRQGRLWLVGFLGAFCLYWVGAKALMTLLPSSKADSSRLIFDTSLFSSCLVAPFIEEVIFRGWMIRRFQPSFGKLGAALISALLFAVFHLQLIGIPHRFVIGLATAAAIYVTRSLWAGVLVHAANNLAVVALPRVHLDPGPFLAHWFAIPTAGLLVVVGLGAMGAFLRRRIAPRAPLSIPGGAPLSTFGA